MLLQVTKENLSKALKKVIKIVGKSALPVLGNVLLEADGAHLALTTTNLETAVRCVIPAIVTEPGKITVPAKDFEKMVSTQLKKSIVELRCQNNVCKLGITVSGNTTTLSGIDAMEFPLVKTDGELVTCVPGSHFKDVIYAYKAAADDDARPVLTAVQLVFKDNTLTAIASDGFWLQSRSMEAPMNGEWAVLVPSRALSVFEAIMDKTLPVDILKRDKQIVFSNGDLHMLVNLPDDDWKYPEYDNIIPKEHAFEAVVNTQGFLQALKVLEPTAKQVAWTTKLTVAHPDADQPHTFALTAQSAGQSESRQAVNITWISRVEYEFGYKLLSAQDEKTGELIQSREPHKDYRIAFNLKYMKALLEGISTPMTWIGFNTNTHPMLVKPVGPTPDLAVMMPMNIGR